MFPYHRNAAMGPIPYLGWWLVVVGRGDTFLYYEANVVTLQLSAQSNTNANTNTNTIPNDGGSSIMRHNYD